jgi:hypothetical protein
MIPVANPIHSNASCSAIWDDRSVRSMDMY